LLTERNKIRRISDLFILFDFVILKITPNVPGVCAVSGGGTPTYKSKKKFVPLCNLTAKPLLISRWLLWRPGALFSQLQVWDVLSSLEEQSDRFSVRSTGLPNPGVCLVCKPSCPGFPELKCLAGNGSGLSYF
jgi:hypothetical protein